MRYFQTIPLVNLTSFFILGSVFIGELPNLKRDTPSSTSQKIKYSITDLGEAAKIADEAKLGINSAGQVSLWNVSDSGVTRVAYWDANRLHFPDQKSLFASSVTRAINSDGIIVGWGSDSANPVDSRAKVSAFQFKNGEMTVLSGFVDGDTRAFGVNASGTIVGATNTSAGKRHGFSWKEGRIEDLAPLPGGSFSQAYAVNDEGVVVGASDSSKPQRRAVLWRNGKVLDLGTFPGGTVSRALAINDRSQVIGFSDSPEGTHAFLWENGKMSDLGTLGSEPSLATAINNRSEAVGSSSLSQSVRHGFLWRKGKMLDLNSLISKDSGWTVLKADAINDSGQIACIAKRKLQSQHALLLTPIAK